MRNEYKIIGNYIEIYMFNRSKELFITQVSRKHLERLLNFDVRWHSDWKPDINNYYAQATIYQGIENGKPKYKTLYLHRFITQAQKGQVVDHKKNSETLDNRDNNLRLSNDANNTKNRKGKNSNNTSGYRNVSWINGFWRIQLQIDGKNKLFSEKFEDVHEAGEFAREMRQKHYGKYKGK